jgi:hypothetical protein
MPNSCPACHGGRVLPVADHYATQVRRPDADPGEAALFAPPLNRALWPGSATIFFFFMAVLGPGFVGPARAVQTGLCFAVPGIVTLALWRRTRGTDRARMEAYRKGRYCPDCGHRF